jgi:tRNA 2-thiouridine synthesizing protein E
MMQPSSQAAREAVSAIPGIPRDGDGPVFRQPWEAHAFAMALTLYERGLFTWSEWAAALAEEIARANGIFDLTDRHWLVIRFMRDTYLATGNAPTIRTLGKVSGVPVKELYELFPKGPAKLAAKIGGIPKPRGCI